jgi:HAD superfamily hydrolase (TIGR01544 family)
MSLVIKNNITLDEKISFFKDNKNQFHVVADFDGTLTQYFDHNGKSRPSIISLLYNEWILDDDYSKQAQALFDHYVQIEHNTTLSLEVRQQAMEDRRTEHKELLMKKWLNYHHLEQITKMDRIVMRSGTDLLLKKLYEQNIPLIIFSASGVGVDSIGLLLKHRWLDFANISIVSNKLYRDEYGTMIGYSKPVIHSLNKTESVIRDNAEYKNIQDQVKDRIHAIVIGDGLHDAEMVDKKSWRTILSIWLCNDKVEERTDRYSDAFDVVITHDEGFEEVIDKIWL